MTRTPDVDRASAGVPTLSVIVPAFKCAGTLREVIAGLQGSDLPRDRWELIVVDDSSPDDTPDVARANADRMLVTSEGPRGPAFARNLGATVARGEVLVFVDADVIVAPTTLSQFAALFAAQPDLAAAFGSYDRSPRDPGLVSQYRNLLHHYVHSLNPGDATTFWAGCGAVRRETFVAVGGFDADRYPRPQIEDIDLGYRIAALGQRILLTPAIQGTHLKRWSLRNMLRTDLRERAVPWMALLIERKDVAGDGPLNLRVGEKVMTALAGVIVLLFLALLVTWDPRLLFAIATACAIIIAGNASLILWFARVRGPIFAIGVVPLRLLFYFTSGFGAAWAILTHRPSPSHRSRPAPGKGTDHAAA